ncbi:MAG: hypothetical protein K2X77_15540 [Candidatus Obscuribacterales bacterium]|jgi:hypothetical protein|nr:hypothetical protein [Candidatus Obscuribacterales bacterium]
MKTQQADRGIVCDTSYSMKVSISSYLLAAVRMQVIDYSLSLSSGRVLVSHGVWSGPAVPLTLTLVHNLWFSLDHQ